MSSPLSDAPFQPHHRVVSLSLHARACLTAVLRLPTVVLAAASEPARRRQLRALGELDDHLLRDLCLSRQDVARACSKSFWSMTAEACPGISDRITAQPIQPEALPLESGWREPVRPASAADSGCRQRLRIGELPAGTAQAALRDCAAP